MGRPVEPLPMDDAQRRVLERIRRSRSVTSRQAQRAQALLLAAEGTSTIKVADQYGVLPETIRRWRAQFRRLGAASVFQTRPGRRLMTDDDFAVDAGAALCGLYLGASERAAVWSDEAAPPSRQRWSCAYRDQRAQNHRDFLRFLRAVETFTPLDADLHVLLDNCLSHTRHDVDQWLSHPRRERFRLYATRDSATWRDLTRLGPPRVELNGAAGQWVFRPTAIHCG